jgi:hypothetical protein
MNPTHLPALLGLGLALALAGCAASGPAATDSAGIERSFDGTAEKTFAAPLNNLRFATLKTLDRMGMPVAADAQTETGWALGATAAERRIDIAFDRVTERTTRMRVAAAGGGLYFKDTATATEIIRQTAETLEADAAAKPATVPARKRKS